MSTDGQTTIMNAPDSHQTPAKAIYEEHVHTRYDIGELVEVKGVTMLVHDVSDQRLVLKFLRLGARL